MLKDGKHILLDFETGGNAQKHPNCVAPSLGVIVFDPAEMLDFQTLVGRGIRFKFNIAEQMQKFGRITDPDTIAWWKEPEQAEAYQRVIMPSAEDISLSQLGPLLDQYLDRMGWTPDDGERQGRVWSRGNAFDMPLFTNIYDYFGWDEPFSFGLVRDIRTKIDTITELWDQEHAGWGYVRGYPTPAGFQKHVELHDCANDIMQMQYSYMKYFEWLDRLITESKQQDL